MRCEPSSRRRTKRPFGATMGINGHPGSLHCGEHISEPNGKARHLRYAQQACPDGFVTLAEQNIKERPHIEIARGQRAHRRIARHIDILSVSDDLRILASFLRRRQLLGQDRRQILRVDIDGMTGIVPFRYQFFDLISFESGISQQLPGRSMASQIDDG